MADVAKWKKEVARLKPLVSAAKAKKDAAQRTLTSLQAQHASADGDLSSSSSNKSAKIQEQHRLEAELVSAQSAVSSAEQSARSLEQSRVQATAARAAAKAELDRITAAAAAADAEHERTRLAKEREAKIIADKEKDRLAAEDRRIADMEAQLRQLQTDKSNAEKELARQEKLQTDNTASLKAARADKERLKREFARIGNGLYPPLSGSEMETTSKLQMDNETLAGQIEQARQAKLQEIDVTGAMFVERLAEEQSNREYAAEKARKDGATEISQMQTNLTFVAQDLDGKDKSGKSDPFMKISFESSRDEYKSETIKKVNRADFKSFPFKISDFGGSLGRDGGYSGSITVSVYDWDRFSKDDLIGQCTITHADVYTGQQKSFDLVNPKYMPGGKSPKPGYVKSGVLVMPQVADFVAKQSNRTQTENARVAAANEQKKRSEQEEKDTNARLAAELQKIQSDQQAAEGERIRLLAEVERHKRELAATTEADHKCDALIASLEQKAVELTAAIKAAKAKLADIVARLAALKAKLADIKHQKNVDQLAYDKQERERKQREAARIKTLTEKQERDRAAVRSAAASVAATVKSESNATAAANATIARKRAEVTRIQHALDAVRREVSSATSNLTHCGDALAQLDTQIAKAKAELTTLTQAYDRLAAELTSALDALRRAEATLKPFLDAEELAAAEAVRMAAEAAAAQAAHEAAMRKAEQDRADEAARMRAEQEAARIAQEAAWAAQQAAAAEAERQRIAWENQQHQAAAMQAEQIGLQQAAAQQAAVEAAAAYKAAEDAKRTFRVVFDAFNLDAKDANGNSDPYLEITSLTGERIYKTEVIKKTLNPEWNRFDLNMERVSKAGKSFKVVVYDWDRFSKPDTIGVAEIDIAAFVQSAGETKKPRWDLINKKKMPGGKKAEAGYQNSGYLQCKFIV